jgi:hypothetical protein
MWWMTLRFCTAAALAARSLLVSYTARKTISTRSEQKPTCSYASHLHTPIRIQEATKHQLVKDEVWLSAGRAFRSGRRGSPSPPSTP